MLCPRPSALRLSALCVPLVMALMAMVPASASAQSCGFTEDHTPATPAPSDLWSGLQPTDAGGLPTAGNNTRDTTSFDRNGGYAFNKPIWQSVDAENGYLFTAINFGIEIWDATTPGRQALPDKKGTVDVRSAVPIIFRNLHNYFIVGDVDAPPGNDDMMAMVGWEGMGTVIWDTSTKTAPRVAYQDGGTQNTEKKGEEVYAATIGGQSYAFAATYALNGGIWVYNMTKAMQVGSTLPCFESRPSSFNPACNGVFVGKISNDAKRHVDGASISADQVTNNFVVFSGGIEPGQKGFEIWNVNNPASPFRVMSGLSTRVVHGVAMFETGGKLYLALAARFPDEGLIYDVSCVTGGLCSLPSSPQYSFPITGVLSSQVLSVTDSKDNGTPYVYYGRKESPNIHDLQGEWLLDVSNIGSTGNMDDRVLAVTGGNPRNNNAGQPTRNEQGTTVGYWSWYYACNPRGSNHLQPRAGVVHDGYFYRAGSSIFDVHRLLDVSPRITVTAGASQGYAGSPVPFSAAATACSPVANGWTWAPSSGGTVVSGGNSSSVQIQWTTPGTKTVSASNSGCPGADITTASVQILDPVPVVSTVTPNITNALICQAVTFNANGVTGRPPLSLDWEILDNQGAPVAPQPTLDVAPDGLSATWDTSLDPPAAGQYRGRLTASNDAGSDSAQSTLVTLAQPAPLAFNGPGGAPSAAISFGSVTFDAQSQGAAEWCWDFGDLTPLFCSTDPVTGPTPTHEYEAVGDYDVTVEISNCIEANPLLSAPLQVHIEEVSPLSIEAFQAQGCFGGPQNCVFNVGETIHFNLTVTGDPTSYDYDWDGNGQFETTSAVPIATHAYTSAGTFSPKVRIQRGGQSATKTHFPIDIESGGPLPTPAITVGGPFSGTVGASYTFTAATSNCSPASNGWTWTTTGGSGGSTSNSITVSWASAGTKTVRASNTGCGTASGSKTISITTGGNNNNGNLAAVFDWTPTSPLAGQAVSFDGTGSTGSPEDYLWSFGDGATASTAQATHTYAAAGSYDVSLTVSRFDPDCNVFGQSICSETTTQTVQVQPQLSGACIPDSETLCLFDGRFQVNARWRNQGNGEEGIAKVYPSFSSNRTGMFWFFRPDNVELIVKTLDGRVVNDSFWVFYGGLSNVEYWLTVVDTETDETVEYHNEPGVICGMPDTDAFPQSPPEQPAPVTAAATTPFHGEPFNVAPITGAAVGGAGLCVETGDNLCLLGGRFSVEVDWVDQRSGDSGQGVPIQGTDRTGYFWFFSPSNVELVTKMIDATEVFGKFWVLWGGLSDVQYFIRVTDTVTQETKVYENPPGSFCGGADTTAFE